MTKFKRAKRWADEAYDKADPYVRGVLAVLLILALVSLLIQSQQAKDAAQTAKILAAQQVKASNRHHAETENQNAQIQKLLTEHSGLLDEVAAQQKAITSAEQAVTADGAYIVAWQEWAANVLTSHCIPVNTCPAPLSPPAP